MAVTNINNRVRITADNDTFTAPGRMCIESILYLPAGTNPEASMKLTNTSGQVLWKTIANETTRSCDQVELIIGAGEVLHFDLAGTGTEVIFYYE